MCLLVLCQPSEVWLARGLWAVLFLLKLLFPFPDESRGGFGIGILTIGLDAPDIISYNISQDCPVVFAMEKPLALERHYMKSNYRGLNPYAYKIWEERINAFRVIARVDTFSLSSKHSEQIAESEGVEILSPQEREVLLYAYLGLTSSETANAMNRSQSTVHAHRDSVRRKVGCKLSAVTLSRLIYAHRAVEEMNYLEPRVGVGKHYNL